MTSGQREAIDQLKAVEATDGGRTLEILEVEPSNERGWVVVQASIDCRGYEATPDGLRLRERERFRICIPPGFPFKAPKVGTAHTRFEGFPHVQWRRQFCLYQSTETEWVPKDGMFGFLRRLDEWLRAGARRDWETEGDPLHPPVDYSGSSDQLIIPRCNTPVFDSPVWTGLATIDRVSDDRADIVGWSSPSELPTDGFLAPTVLLGTEFPFEYPQTIGGLFSELARAGVDKPLVMALLKCAVLLNGADEPIYFVVGTPMRGVVGERRKQHLSVWKIPAQVAEWVGLTIEREGDPEEVRDIRDDLAGALLQGIKDKRPSWCRVREARPEILTRRDHDSPMAWFHDRKVSLWGCGALGGHIAIMLARAGVQELILRDNGIVAPGLLVRQPFSDADLGAPKVHALKEKLLAIDSSLSVEAMQADLVSNPLDNEDWTDGADVVIDASANRIVRQKLEQVRAEASVPPVPVLSLLMDGNAQRGAVAVAQNEYSGGPADLFRKTKIRLTRHISGEEWRGAFWPADDDALFQPEPGCSSPTFVGSAADSMALAGALLNAGVAEIKASPNQTGTTRFMAAPHASAQEQARDFRWRPDLVLQDVCSGYEVRISQSAWRSISGWIQKQARAGDPKIETGGVLFGERDDAAKLLYVDDVIGPPPDSVASREEFICGTSGVQTTNERKRDETDGSVAFVGMWHTHPDGEPFPSPRDVRGMSQIVESAEPTPRRALLLIIGTDTTAGTTSDVAAFVFDRDRLSTVPVAGLHPAPTAPPDQGENNTDDKVGLALSGGGSRAVAFHLGCLRALHDTGLLSHVHVISGVSGGSIIAGLYGYTDEPFHGFEERVYAFLRRGLHKPTLREAVRPGLLTKTIRTVLGAGTPAMGASAVNAVAKAMRLLGARNQSWQTRLEKLKPAVPRRWSRTDAFEAALRKQVVGDTKLTSPRRQNLELVFNAAELRTLSAFRFGSQKSGSWRFGELAKNDTISLAHAIAASAAYPPVLPAFDKEYQLKQNGRTSNERLILSDGGIYDNLGVRCLEPGRDPDVSHHVFELPLIVCCDAGHGLPQGDDIPYWWPSRMTRSVLSALRQVQRATQNRLHRYTAEGQLEGFIYPYLGMRDERLPYRPPGLVPREQVASYPADFAPMDTDQIELLADRGEVLTRLLVDYYAPLR